MYLASAPTSCVRFTSTTTGWVAGHTLFLKHVCATWHDDYDDYSRGERWLLMFGNQTIIGKFEIAACVGSAFERGACGSHFGTFYACMIADGRSPSCLDCLRRRLGLLRIRFVFFGRGVEMLVDKNTKLRTMFSRDGCHSQMAAAAFWYIYIYTHIDII